MSRIKNKNQVIKKNIEIMNNKDDWDDVSDGWHTFGVFTIRDCTFGLL